MSAFWDKCERYGELISSASEAVQTGLDARDLMQIPVIGPPLAVGAVAVNAANVALAARALSREARQPQRFIAPGQTIVYNGTRTGRTVEFTDRLKTSGTLILNNNVGQRLVRNFAPGETVTFDFEPGETVSLHFAPPF